MTYLEKLLEGVEVEWKPLGKIVNLITTGRLNANAMEENGQYPFFTCNESPYRINTYAFDLEAILISGNGSQVGHLNYYNGKFNAYQRTYIVSEFKSSIDVMFLFHYMNCHLKNYIIKNSRRGSVPYITMPMLVDFLIPIPPLEIQQKIVNILDTFTELTAGLTAELTARKKQYEYYREQLLTFEDGEVEWKTLGEIGNIKMCKRILKKDTKSKGDVPFYKIGTFGKQANAYISKELYTLYRTKYPYPKKGDVLISASGTIGRTVIYNGEPAYFQDSNIVWIENDESIVTNKYLWHFYKIAKWFVSEGGTIKRLYNENIKKTRIPIPPLEEQARIVSILDKFDTLTSSISEGLPREIELRNKQYEYYRDLLLAFPKEQK